MNEYTVLPVTPGQPVTVLCDGEPVGYIYDVPQYELRRLLALMDTTVYGTVDLVSLDTSLVFVCAEKAHLLGDRTTASLARMVLASRGH